MADISKINTNSTEYNIKDTTARDGLTDRPTSFVGTRSEWNALPVATQVKYSLVNLKGEGVYKNNGTGLEKIADVGGGTSDYSALNNKPKINGVELAGNKTTGDLNIDYNDLSNKPTIPAAQVNSDWNASSGVAEILNKPSSYTPSSHKHGNIQNGGTLQTTDVAIANGDKLVVTDSSNSAKIARTSVAFDGTTTTQALSKKGTFETFSKFSGSYIDLTNKPSINSVELSGNKTTSDLGINADNVMLSDGVTSVEDIVSGTFTAAKNVTILHTKVRKQLNIVSLDIFCQKDLTANQWNHVGDISANFAPDTYNMVFPALNNTDNGVFEAKVQGTSIEVYPNVSGTKNFSIVTTYITTN